MYRILHPNPNERPLIEEIRTHAWLMQGVANEDEVRQELERRRQLRLEAQQSITEYRYPNIFIQHSAGLTRGVALDLGSAKRTRRFEPDANRTHFFFTEAHPSDVFKHLEAALKQFKVHDFVIDPEYFEMQVKAKHLILLKAGYVGSKLADEAEYRISILKDESRSSYCVDFVHARGSKTFFAEQATRVINSFKVVRIQPVTTNIAAVD